MRTIYIKYIEISLLRSFFQSKKQVERSGRTVKTIKRLIRRTYRENIINKWKNIFRED